MTTPPEWVQADIEEEAERLLAEAEAELGRPLTPEEEDSLLGEFLAGLDEEGEETPP